jgi:WD40 repeat protein
MTVRFVYGTFSMDIVYKHSRVTAPRYTVLSSIQQELLLEPRTAKYEFGIVHLGKCFLFDKDKSLARTTTTNASSSTLLASFSIGNGIPAQIRARNGTLISTGKNGALTFWNKSWLGEDHTVLAHDSIIVALYMTDTDLFTGGMDGVVKKWDLQSGNLAQEISTRYRNLHVIVVDQQVVIAVSTDDAHTALEVSNKGLVTSELRSRIMILLPFHTVLY